jgi:DNA polymerase-3 subunit gamma/tau
MAGSYTVLARRYRSRDFDEIVGQEAIARTLRNAVAARRLGHAYLFCGSRGVGKTSMARILARAINAAPGGLTEAAEIGEAILRGNDLDVIEIDGASNRGVEDARSLIAAAGLKPARCEFKIYIIDEVHMLTKDAFNTLLKTMEEPPEHVKFILCTTEPEKLPPTVRSRCQRFDFRLLSSAEIGGQLRRILASERVDVDDQVIAQVARLARGSMRDALSLLDRLLAAGEAKLTVPLMEELLGLPDHALASALVDAIAAGDPAAGLRAGSAMIDGGASVEQALEVLMEQLRDLLLIAACGSECDFLELTPEARAAAAEQAKRFDPPGLVHLIAVCESAARSARLSAVARAIFDAAIVRMCRSERFADVAALLGEGGAGEAAGAKKKGAVAPPRPAVEIDAAPPADDPGRALWEAACRGASSSPGEHALVEHLAFLGFDGRTLRLAITAPQEGLAGWLATQSAAVADLVSRAAARRVEVAIEAPAPAPGGSAAARKRSAEELPLVRSAMAIFDATVVDVKDEDDV